MSRRKIKLDELRTCENCGDYWGFWSDENDKVLCFICEPSVLKSLFEKFYWEGEETPTQQEVG